MLHCYAPTMQYVFCAYDQQKDNQPEFIFIKKCTFIVKYRSEREKKMHKTKQIWLKVNVIFEHFWPKKHIPFLNSLTQTMPWHIRYTHMYTYTMHTSHGAIYTHTKTWRQADRQKTHTDTCCFRHRHCWHLHIYINTEEVGSHIFCYLINRVNLFFDYLKGSQTWLDRRQLFFYVNFCICWLLDFSQILLVKESIKIN